jgi:hypothetical protein
MHSLSVAHFQRFLLVLLAVLTVLMLLSVLLLPHLHIGTTHLFVQSTESILD